MGEACLEQAVCISQHRAMSIQCFQCQAAAVERFAIARVQLQRLLEKIERLLMIALGGGVRSGPDEIL